MSLMRFTRTTLNPGFFVTPVGMYTRSSKHPPISEIGLELELEGFGASLMPVAAEEVGGYWLTHVDASLRGESCELVLRRPVSMEEFHKNVIPEYTKIISIVNFKPALSNRCSFHVHLDFSHKTLYDLIRFVTVYSIFEQYFYLAVGPERRGNHFCVALKEAQTFVDSAIKGLSSGDFSFAAVEDNRYMALNLASLFKFGSVEIRLHEGVYEPDKIVAWVEVLYELLDYAKNRYEDTPQDLIEQISMNGFERLAEQKFPKTWELVKPFYTSAILRDGLDIAQDIAYSLSWVNAPREVPKQPPAKKSRGKKLNPLSEEDREAQHVALVQRARAIAPLPRYAADHRFNFLDEEIS